MNITVHIERLVLDGVVTNTRDGRAVQQALSDALALPEMRSTLSARSVREAGATAVRQAEAIAPVAGAEPAAWGAPIAQAITGTLA
jgi:hypothetical protein